MADTPVPPVARESCSIDSIFAQLQYFVAQLRILTEVRQHPDGEVVFAKGTLPR